MKISVIYRCSEEDTKKEFRPKRFSKLNCLDNFLEVFRYNPINGVEVNIHPIHDGPCGLLHAQLEFHDLNIEKINVRSNEKSLIACLEFAAGLYETDIIYFLEDDYVHTLDALKVLVEGFNLIGAYKYPGIISLYDHPDRYTRTDDIDRGQSHILLGPTRYWRTAESTTCTWATTQSTFIQQGVYEAAMLLKLKDREFFRALRSIYEICLFTPMMAASTHCHLPFMSPFVNWDELIC